MFRWSLPCSLPLSRGRGPSDPHSESPLGPPAEDLVRPRKEFPPVPRVVSQGRTGEEEASTGVEDLWVEGRDGAARLAAQDQVSTGRQAVQAFLERRLADGGVDHLDPPSAG